MLSQKHQKESNICGSVSEENHDMTNQPVAEGSPKGGANTEDSHRTLALKLSAAASIGWFISTAGHPELLRCTETPITTRNALLAHASASGRNRPRAG